MLLSRQQTGWTIFDRSELGTVLKNKELSGVVEPVVHSRTSNMWDI